MSEAPRAYVASHFAIEVDGQVIGFCRSVEGGNMKAEVLSYQLSNKQLDTWRYGGKPKFDDITVQVGMGMSETFYKWIDAFFRRQEMRRDGAILAADFSYTEKARRTFKQALISEIQMPAVDGADKNPCYMTVKFAVEDLIFENGKGQKIMPKPGMPGPHPGEAQKKWLAANFSLQLDTLDDGLKRVLKVDGFTIKQQILDYHHSGKGHRFPIKVPGRLEYPNMTFYVPEVDSKVFVDTLKKRWRDHVPKAGSGIGGFLTYLGSDNKTELCTIKLEGVDVISVEPDKYESSSDNIHKMKVGIHVEKMTFKYKAGRAAG